MPSIVTGIAYAVLGSGLFLVAYVYLGYPLLLFLMSRKARISDAPAPPAVPTVSLIISAYNEEDVIEAKIRNSLVLDYPSDRFEIIVVSDCSTDRTDDIVSSFASQGVSLVRMSARRGKTAGLNEAVMRSRSDILVFSDANAFYRPDAIRELARGFRDPEVGCVTGESRYVQEGRSTVTEQESLYWKYERQLKIWESACGSMVGSDGAILALRRQLYEPLQPTDLNDFVVPLQTVRRGFRCVYRPEAVCDERGTALYEEEFRRKVRVVNRSVYALRRTGDLLNPFRHGLFAVQLLSHKVLRWTVGFQLIAIFVASAVLAPVSFPVRVLFSAEVIFGAVAILGFLAAGSRSRWVRALTLPTYFCLVNWAAVLGVISGLQGRIRVTWTPERTPSRPPGSRASVLPLLLSVVVVGALISIALRRSLAEPTFWISASSLLYVYLGYPLLLRVVSAISRRGVQRERLTPDVTLLIVAHNEGEVITRKLLNSLALDYPRDRLRILVASDGSTDDTEELVRLFADRRIELLALPIRSGKSGAIRAALPLIESEIVFFSDANVLYRADAIRAVVSCFADPTVGAATGNVALVNEHLFYGTGETVFCRYEAFLHHHETRAGSLIGVDGAMYAVRRSLCRPPRQDTILDDFSIGMAVVRQRKRVVYVPDAIGWEVSSPSAAAEAERRTRVVAGGVQSLLRGDDMPGPTQFLVWFEYLSHKVARWLTPVFLSALLASNLALSGRPAYRLILALHIAFYLLGAYGAVTRRRSALTAVPFYVSMAALAAGIGLYQGLLSRQDVRWKVHPRVVLPDLSEAERVPASSPHRSDREGG